VSAIRKLEVTHFKNVLLSKPEVLAAMEEMLT
jgi:hypothetical protein